MALRVIMRYGQQFAGFIGMIGSLRFLTQATAVKSIKNEEDRETRKEADLKVSKQKGATHPFSWIGSYTPCFGVNGKQIQVLHEPAQFYEVLKDEFRRAKKRIVISSLYLGTGHHEQDLVDSIRQACQAAKNNPSNEFEVHILLDFQRGSRGLEKSSRAMLTPLLQEFNGTVHVHLFHTPNLRGMVKSILPHRVDETFGINHMKVYLADDNFVISGANLSESYFTDRQDRYVLFKNCSKLADFFTKLVLSVASLSFVLHPDNSVQMSPKCSSHPFQDKDGGLQYKKEARERILSVIRQESDEQTTLSNTGSKSDVDTWIYPLVQMHPFDIDDDEQVTKKLFKAANIGDRVLLASGYFNLTDDYMDIIVKESKAIFDVLMGSPETNGFFGSKGISGYIPYLYVETAKNFHDLIREHFQTSRVSLQEYRHLSWSFHAKGLWYYFNKQQLPAMSVVGSSNFGCRSVSRDLECQVVISTKNKELQKQFKQEHVQLFEKSTPVSEEVFNQKDRHVPLWVKLVTRTFKTFF